MRISRWRKNAGAVALKACNDELKRMHKLLYQKHLDFDMTKTEVMDRIVIIQEVVNKSLKEILNIKGKENE